MLEFCSTFFAANSVIRSDKRNKSTIGISSQGHHCPSFLLNLLNQTHQMSSYPQNDIPLDFDSLSSSLEFLLIVTHLQATPLSSHVFSFHIFLIILFDVGYIFLNRSFIMNSFQRKTIWRKEKNAIVLWFNSSRKKIIITCTFYLCKVYIT